MKLIQMMSDAEHRDSIKALITLERTLWGATVPDPKALHEALSVIRAALSYQARLRVGPGGNAYLPPAPPEADDARE